MSPYHCSALYARNPDPELNQDRMDPAHKAQDVGKSTAIYVQNLDAFALPAHKDRRKYNKHSHIVIDSDQKKVVLAR